jgi:hypothetical protein
MLASFPLRLRYEDVLVAVTVAVGPILVVVTVGQLAVLVSVTIRGCGSGARCRMRTRLASRNRAFCSSASRRNLELIMVAAGPMVMRAVATGSTVAARVGILQDAVRVDVVFPIWRSKEVSLIVRRAFVVVVVTRAGVTVIVGVTVVEGLITVLGGRTVVKVSVLVEVMPVSQ